MIVKVPRDPKDRAELNIDDFMVAVVDINGNASRANKAVPLAIHTMGRPLLSHEPTPRKDFISSEKWQSKQARVNYNETSVGTSIQES